MRTAMSKEVGAGGRFHIFLDFANHHSLYTHTLPLIHTDFSSTAVTNVAQSKPISFCNNHGLSSNLNSVHQRLQSLGPRAVFLTEAKSKPLDSKDNSTRSPHMKCPGYELFSSFFFNCGVCTFIHSDVQSSRLLQFNLSNPGFQLIWLKISLPNTSKFACTLYRLPNSTNHELLFDHLSKSSDTIILHSPRSQNIILGDFNVHNPDKLKTTTSRHGNTNKLHNLDLCYKTINNAKASFVNLISNKIAYVKLDFALSGP